MLDFTSNHLAGDRRNCARLPFVPDFESAITPGRISRPIVTRLSTIPCQFLQVSQSARCPSIRPYVRAPPRPVTGSTDLATRVLVVDDFDPWRRFASTALQRQPDMQIVGEASDGPVAVQKAQQLQPDLILLDIGLPGLNGIQASRRIRELSPKSKILFVTENHSPETAREAVRAGAHGYVVKSSAGSELLPAIRAVLRGEFFASACLGLTGHASSSGMVLHTASSDQPASLMGSQLRLWNEELREVAVNGCGDKS